MTARHPTGGGMRRRARLALAALLTAGVACNGYAEIEVPQRELATLTVEAVALYPDAVGQLQLAVTADDLPSDVPGPLWVVGAPQLSAPTLRAVNFAVGPCPALGGPTDPVLLRLCVAIEAAAGVAPEAFIVQVVFETRAAARRFTAAAEVTP